MFKSIKLGAVILLTMLAVACGSKSGGSSSAPAPQQPEKPTGSALSATYCAGCHSSAKPSGDIALDTANANKLNASKALDELQGGDMPPEGSKLPTADERAALIEWYKTL